MDTPLRQIQFPGGQVCRILQADITQLKVDAIVNAANAHLLHGGGVAGVIAQRGGPEIVNESSRWVREHGPVTHAEPAYTRAGRLPCRFVIHAVGPVWGEGDEDRKLQAAVAGSLRRAEALQARSLALPAISTGIFGFPKERAASLILAAIIAYFAENPVSVLQEVTLALYDPPTTAAFLHSWDEAFPAS